MDETSTRQEISAADLQQLSAPLVKGQRLQAPAWDHRSALLTGRMWVTELEPGMQLRLADVHDKFGLTSQAFLPAGVKIALVVKGSAHVRYGAFETRLGPDNTFSALIAALPSKTDFMRIGQAGALERTLTLSLSPNWLARHGYMSLVEFSTYSPYFQHWTPSPGLLALALRLFSPNHEQTSLARRLQLIGLATLLAGEALAVLPERVCRFSPANRHRPRLSKLMALIDNGKARGMAQSDLAKQLGMSLSTLQRCFYREYGEPLGQFLRRHYLKVARDALQQEAISIETAASLAGYTNATNFATAFKREFGIQPSHHQRQLSIPKPQ